MITVPREEWLRQEVYSPARMVQSFVVAYTMGLLYQYELYMSGNEIMTVVFVILLIALMKMSYSLSTYLKIRFFLLVMVAVTLSFVRFSQASESFLEAPPFYVGGEAILTGVVDDRPSLYAKKGEKYRKTVIQLEYVASKKQSATKESRAKGNILAYVPVHMEVQRGDRVAIEGNVSLPFISPHKGAPDMRGRYYSNDLQGAIYEVTALHVLKREFSFFTFMDQWRTRNEEYIISRLGDRTGGVLNALIFGAEYSMLPEEINENFSRTGLIHILSVSGSHIALVLALAYGTVYYLPVSKRKKMIVALLMVWAYALVVGLSPPVLRSALMGSIGAIAVCFGYTRAALQCIAIVAFLQLWRAPLLVGDISFQLSYGAVLGILVFYKLLYQGMTLFPKYVRAAIALTLSAQVLVIPLQLYYFQMLSIASIPTNIMVAPILEIAIAMGLIVLCAKTCMGVIAVLPGLAFIEPGSAIILEPIVYIIGLTLKLALFLDFSIGAIPGGVFSIAAPLYIASILYYGTILCFLYYWEGLHRGIIKILFCILLIVGVSAEFVKPSIAIHIFNDARLKAILVEPKSSMLWSWGKTEEAVLFIDNSSRKGASGLTARNVNDLKRFLNFYGIDKPLIFFSMPLVMPEDEVVALSSAIAHKGQMIKGDFHYEQKNRSIFVEPHGGQNILFIRNETRAFLFGNGQRAEKKLKLEGIRELYIDSEMFTSVVEIQDVVVKQFYRPVGRSYVDVDPESGEIYLIGRQNKYTFGI